MRIRHWSTLSRSGGSRIAPVLGVIALVLAGSRARGGDAPAPVPAKPAEAAPAAATTSAASPASSTEAGAPPVEISLKSHDGFAFKALYLAPPAATSNAVLIIPDIGSKRDHFLRLARKLSARGYRVLSMDNMGQLRQVGRGPNGRPSFTPLTTKILDSLVLDATASLTSLRAQTGVARVAVVGFGIGANTGVLLGGVDSAVDAVGVVVPNYGCEGFDPYAAFGDLNFRPVLLLESRKKWQSDLSNAFQHIMIKRPDLPFDHVMLLRDKEAVTRQDLEEDYEDSLLVWIEKAFPSAAH